MRKESKERRYRGRMPRAADGWVQVGEWQVTHGIRWLVFAQPQADPSWATYKVAFDGSVECKANYWFVQNLRTGKTAFSRDLGLMKDRRPALHEQVMRILAEQRTADIL